jgi:DNA topoisomerase IA
VDRHDDITSFVPEDFWVLDCDVAKPGTVVKLEWERGRVFDREVPSQPSRFALFFASDARVSGFDGTRWPECSNRM